MLDELRRLDHLPRRLRIRTDDLKKAQHKLGSELGREATLEEVAHEMNIDLEEVGGDGGPARAQRPAGERAVPAWPTSHDLDDEAARREALRSAGRRRSRRCPSACGMVLGLVYLEA